jgi:hypothetical protein
MRLPDEIPPRLRQDAVYLPGFGDGQGAWLREDAIAVIESLEGTTIAVSEVTPFRRVLWGTETHWSVCDTVWSVHRLHSESDVNYARRTRRESAEFIAEFTDEDDEPLFALTFPMWKDAA